MVGKAGHVEGELGIPPELHRGRADSGDFLMIGTVKSDSGCCPRSDVPGPGGSVHAEVVEYEREMT